jgi:hypothetical protein
MGVDVSQLPAAQAALLAAERLVLGNRRHCQLRQPLLLLLVCRWEHHYVIICCCCCCSCCCWSV